MTWHPTTWCSTRSECASSRSARRSKKLDDDARDLAPEVPWAEIARMRDMLAHRYFDTTHAIVMATARNDVPRLAEAVRRMLGREG